MNSFLLYKKHLTYLSFKIIDLDNFLGKIIRQFALHDTIIVAQVSFFKIEDKNIEYYLIVVIYIIHN